MVEKIYVTVLNAVIGGLFFTGQTEQFTIRIKQSYYINHSLSYAMPFLYCNILRQSQMFIKLCYVY